ncbi:MAG TPA: HAMP domain-containing protein [Anaerolineae bacterium]|nr:HAMP domain-containing protein [Anaerolineae bacterium]HQK12610.1 HAMP domain-containing protein [Anaerolineae bacterium]
MKISTRLILSFLLVSLLPLAAIGYAGLRAMERIRSLAIEESTAALKHLGEEAIRQKAEDVSRQVSIYLQAHPQATLEDLQTNETFRNIAMQKVGETGYTVLYEAGTGMVRLHPNATLIDHPMRELAEKLPSFWAVFEPSLVGAETAGYYDWLDPDNSIREKYMVMTPVATPFHDVTFMIAATTYIDEFSRPIQVTNAKITSLTQQIHTQLILILIVVAGLAISIAVGLARSIGQPLRQLTFAAEMLERGDYHMGLLLSEIRRHDDLGHLARIFDRMAQEVIARETRLKIQVMELHIEIDEVKKARQVTAITETEYFQQLQQKAEQLRARSQATNKKLKA